MRTFEWVGYTQIAEVAATGGGVAIGTYTATDDEVLHLGTSRRVTLAVEVFTFTYTSPALSPYLDLQSTDTPDLPLSWGTTPVYHVEDPGAAHSIIQIVQLARDLPVGEAYRCGEAIRWKVVIPAPTSATSSRIAFRITATLY